MALAPVAGIGGLADLVWRYARDVISAVLGTTVTIKRWCDCDTECKERLDTEHKVGFVNGNATGFLEGHKIGNATGYFEGHAKGQATGYFQGEAVGKTIGSLEGHAKGYDVGYLQGKVTGNAIGYIEGQASGFTQGLMTGIGGVVLFPLLIWLIVTITYCIYKCLDRPVHRKEQPREHKD